MSGNYFEVGIALIEHLRAKADEWGVKHIGMASSINSINKQITPAIYVVNTANNPVDIVAGTASLDLQQWTVVIAVSEQSAQTDVIELMRASGELISNVINYVQGFEVDDYHAPLERAGTAGRPQYFSTFALYPFTFQTKIQP